MPRSMPMTSLARSTAPVLRHMSCVLAADRLYMKREARDTQLRPGGEQAEEAGAYVNALMSSPMELQVFDAVCAGSQKHRQASHAVMRMF